MTYSQSIRQHNHLLYTQAIIVIIMLTHPLCLLRGYLDTLVGLIVSLYAPRCEDGLRTESSLRLYLMAAHGSTTGLERVEVSASRDTCHRLDGLLDAMLLAVHGGCSLGAEQVHRLFSRLHQHDYAFPSHTIATAQTMTTIIMDAYTLKLLLLLNASIGMGILGDDTHTEARIEQQRQFQAVGIHNDSRHHLRSSHSARGDRVLELTQSRDAQSKIMLDALDDITALMNTPAAEDPRSPAALFSFVWSLGLHNLLSALLPQKEDPTIKLAEGLRCDVLGRLVCLSSAVLGLKTGCNGKGNLFVVCATLLQDLAISLVEGVCLREEVVDLIDMREMVVLLQLTHRADPLLCAAFWREARNAEDLAASCKPLHRLFFLLMRSSTHEPAIFLRLLATMVCSQEAALDTLALLFTPVPLNTLIPIASLSICLYKDYESDHGRPRDWLPLAQWVSARKLGELEVDLSSARVLLRDSSTTQPAGESQGLVSAVDEGAQTALVVWETVPQPPLPLVTISFLDFVVLADMLVVAACGESRARS
jgi:hypothetical protein